MTALEAGEAAGEARVGGKGAIDFLMEFLGVHQRLEGEVGRDDLLEVENL